MTKQIELVKGQIFEVKPNKRYMVIFNEKDISHDDAHRLNLGTSGNLVVLIRGNPADVKLIEMAEKE